MILTCTRFDDDNIDDWTYLYKRLAVTLRRWWWRSRYFAVETISLALNCNFYSTPGRTWKVCHRCFIWRRAARLWRSPTVLLWMNVAQSNLNSQYYMITPYRNVFASTLTSNSALLWCRWILLFIPQPPYIIPCIFRTHGAHPRSCPACFDSRQYFTRKL